MLHSTFKELSNDTLHAQIRVQTKKLCYQQVGEEKQAVEHKLCRDISRLCRDKAYNKARNFVVTKFIMLLQSQRQAKDKLFRNRVFLSQQSFSVATKFLFVTTEFFYRNKVFFCHNRVFEFSLCCDIDS